MYAELHLNGSGYPIHCLFCALNYVRQDEIGLPQAFIEANFGAFEPVVKICH